MAFQRLPTGEFAGVAGEAYGQRDIIVAHRKMINGQYRWDRDTYVDFGENEDLYNAIACVPIIGTPHHSLGSNRLGVRTSQKLSEEDCLGVLCFDSSDGVIFDSPEAREILEKLARHLAACLQIYTKLSQACSISSCIYAKAKPVA